MIRNRVWQKEQGFKPLLLRILFGAFPAVLSSTAVSAEGVEQVKKTELLPSEALLNFLLEFDGVDDETFNLLTRRGIKDIQTSRKKLKRNTHSVKAKATADDGVVDE